MPFNIYTGLLLLRPRYKTFLGRLSGPEKLPCSFQTSNVFLHTCRWLSAFRSLRALTGGSTHTILDCTLLTPVKWSVRPSAAPEAAMKLEPGTAFGLKGVWSLSTAQSAFHSCPTPCCCTPICTAEEKELSTPSQEFQIQDTIRLRQRALIAGHFCESQHCVHQQWK